jgi:hypothetical protein
MTECATGRATRVVYHFPCPARPGCTNSYWIHIRLERVLQPHAALKSTPSGATEDHRGSSHAEMSASALPLPPRAVENGDPRSINALRASRALSRAVRLDQGSCTYGVKTALRSATCLCPAPAAALSQQACAQTTHALSRAPPHALRLCSREQPTEPSRPAFTSQFHRAEYTCTSASTNKPLQCSRSRSCSASQSQGLPPHLSCMRSRGQADCPRAHPSRSGERGGGPDNYRFGCCRNIACRSRRRSAGTSSPNRPASLTAKRAVLAPHHAARVPATKGARGQTHGP